LSVTARPMFLCTRVGRDYHKLLRSRLQALGQSLKQHLPGLEFRAF